MTLVSGSVYFGRVSLVFLWRAGSYFLSLWGFAVWNVGPVQFIWALAGVDGGAVQVFFFLAPLWWVRYGLFECWLGVGGGAVQFFWYYLSALCL